MNPGELVGDRFVIERVAGTGGMGAVYRARDEHTGETVALKVLHAQSAEGAKRFVRERLVLAELTHPGIVRYVAHGATRDGRPFLAMEWLDGHDLASRIRQSGLTLADTLTVGAQVAAALGALHRRGVVHRDIKPGNVFLVGGAVERVKLLDFGVAHVATEGQALTATGVMLGTPGYMAPEQARGDRDVDARADVFALGALLFRCLTGRTPFEGDTQLAVLLKVVLEEAPRVRSLAPLVPAAVDDLVAEMLARPRSARPADASVVAARLASLGVPDADAPLSVAPPSLGTGERRLMGLVLARLSRLDPEEEATLAIGEIDARDRSLRAEIARHRGTLERLADGSLLVSLHGAEAPTDLAARGARCALAMRRLLPDAPMALVAGRGVVTDATPVGAIIQRGVELVEQRPSGEVDDRDLGAAIRVDEVTAGLLDDRFDVGTDRGGPVLRGTRDAGDTTRTLLGRPTPCLGRDRELSGLEALLDECIGDSVARVALVVAPAGVGKSRLRFELVQRIERAAPERPVQIWAGRGDPMSAGSPLGLLASALRRGLGLDGPVDLAARRELLRVRVARHFTGGEASRVAEFVGELCGVPFAAEHSPKLAAARRDAMVMGDQMRRAWQDLLDAECRALPVLLVLEDLHWGDLPTVAFVDAALRDLADRPWMVLALGRPEVAEAFPGLWAERELQEIRLSQLTRRASEKLVQAVLGHAAPQATVARIVERAGGNAFYLEELIRAVAEGKEALPETVLAMAEARLDDLDPQARRVLRAGSVFGQVFWQGGVEALLGMSETGPGPSEWLRALEAREVVTRRATTRFADQPELVFRHALVREAAYATLTERDRALGHRLAAAWLERVGETDAAQLAEHAHRGGEPGRAARWYLRAAQQALGANDFAGAIQWAERGVTLTSGETAGALRLVQAEAYRWRGETAAGLDAAVAALALLPPGRSAWYGAASELAIGSGKLGERERLDALVDALLASEPGPDDGVAFAIALVRAATQLLYARSFDVADALLARAERATQTPDPVWLGRLHQARSLRALLTGDTSGYLSHTRLAAEHFEAGGDLRTTCMQRANLGYGLMEIGLFAEAERVLSDVLAMAQRTGLKNVVAYAQHNLGLALARQGSLESALAVERAASVALCAQGDRRLEGVSRIYLSLILALAGDLAAAEAEAKTVVDGHDADSPIRFFAQAALAAARLARGATAEALEPAREALEALERIGTPEDGDAFTRLVAAEALEAGGDHEGARRAIGRARERLMERAERINDPAWRKSFLENVPENARTVQLWEAWEEG